MNDRQLTPAVLTATFEAVDNAALAREERRMRALDRMFFVDDLELSITGGCPACGLEHDQMCVGCGRCNCDRHDTCTRSAA